MSIHRSIARRAALLVAALAVPVLGVALPATSASAVGPAVGVLPDVNGNCPNGTSGKFSVYQDDEDTDNDNQRYGWIGGTVSSANTLIPLCRTDGSAFSELIEDDLRVNFAVVALGGRCPQGSLTVERYVDNQDGGNSHSNVPNGSLTRTQNLNTVWVFCWFIKPDGKRAAQRTDFPHLNGSYGVFGGATVWNSPFGAPYRASGNVYSDDEDHNNKNSVTNVGAFLKPYLDYWLNTGANTRFRMVQVN
jgi:hypothetical protein